MKNLNRRTFQGILILLILITSYSGIKRRDINKQDRKSIPVQTITGTVYNKDGIPLEGINVSLYCDCDDYPGSPITSSVTSADGTFDLKADSFLLCVLEIKGDQGAGRVLVTSERLEKGMHINYPVLEELIILHTNDQHFDINKPDELASKIKEIRNTNQDVFLLSAGDVFVRHSPGWNVNGIQMDETWYAKRSVEMISEMNKLKYHAMTLGNHELGYIETYTRNALETASFPLLAANLEVETDKLPEIVPYLILMTSTWRKIAVLGITADKSLKEGVRELDIIETIKKYLFLRDSSDIFIALTHTGTRKDHSIAMAFPQIDAIIGGHSHDLLREAVFENNVLIAQAGGNRHIVSDNHPVFLGKINFILENGQIKEKSGIVIEIAPNRDSLGYLEE